MLDKKDTQSIQYSSQDCKLDENVEKNIIDFFNEDIIDVKEITEKKTFGTELLDNLKKTQSFLNNINNNNANDKIENKSKVSKLTLDDFGNRKLVKSCRDQAKEIEEEKDSYEKKLIKTEPSANSLLKGSYGDNSKLRERGPINVSNNNHNIFSLELESTSESKFLISNYVFY